MEPHAEHPVRSIPLVPRGEAELIDTQDGLAALVERLRAVPSFAYDTEFIGEESYYPRICVVQIATAEFIALVDPLSGLDLTPLWRILADPSIEKVVHAGGQDLAPVMRALGCPPANVFDTQIAAGFAGYPYPLGLRHLVEAFLGVKLGKAMTFTKWDERPLSRIHLRYAADDVRYLPAIRERLRNRLESLGHEGWVREECEALCAPSQFVFDADATVTRLIATRSLRPREVGMLRALVELRDELSRRHDLPPRTLLKDDVLIRLTGDHPRTLDQLARVKGLPRPLIEAHGKDLVGAIERGGASARTDLPSPPPQESADDRFRIESLWTFASAVCHGNRVDPALAASRRRIAQFHFGARSGGGDGGSGLFSGWREQLLGRTLRDLLSGGGATTFRWIDQGLDCSERVT